MIEHPPILHQRNLEDTLKQIIYLLNKQQLVSHLVKKQDSPRQELIQTLVAKQQLAELRQKLQSLHPADIAYVLEQLPLPQRIMVWDLIDVKRYGAVLLEVSDAVRASLIDDLEHKELIHAVEHLESDEIADLMPDLPSDMVIAVMKSLDQSDREQVQSVMTFPEGSVGALMEFDVVLVREDISIDVVLRYLRRRGEIPNDLDQLFVVNREGLLKGGLKLNKLLISSPDSLVSELMNPDVVFFYTHDNANEATGAFERYDLISAPVLNSHNHVVGRIGIDLVMDFVEERAKKERLGQVGLTEEEDLFAPVWHSARNRWLWLAVNLMTAFFASRVISVFEDAIVQLVALATLMPIVASVGGNTGNQTAALVIRGLALKQINPSNIRYLFAKELGISLLNGTLWGSVMGLFTFVLYQNMALSLVMTSAMILNLIIAALIGTLVPLTLHRLKRDPAIGSSVMLTFMTDSMGFFIFLGLAVVVLL
jgi:magnesium transporter